MNEHDPAGRLWIWPWQRHRIHLEQEIEYLRQQLAQQTRRNDELEQRIEAKITPKVQYEQKPDGKLSPIQPKGWDAYRYSQRQKPKEEESDAVSS